MQAFIYEWLDTKTQLKYIGRHVGHIDDGYIGSGTVFINKYNSRPEDFIRTILWIDEYTTDDEIKLQEELVLSKITDDELYYGADRKYYNQVRNSHGFTCTDNPMLNAEVVSRMVETRKEKEHKNVHQNTIAKYGKEEWTRMNSINKKGNTFGSGNAGNTKTVDHKNNIAASINQMYKTKKELGIVTEGKSSGRKRAMPYEDIVNAVKELGFKEAAIKLNLEVAILKGRYYNARKALNKTQ